jgi:hypothetical protein
MAYNYTRQPGVPAKPASRGGRQGRDFSIIDHLRAAKVNADGGCDIDGIIPNNSAKADAEKKKSLLEQLEQCKAEAERSLTPIDGREPDGSSPEKAR